MTTSRSWRTVAVSLTLLTASSLYAGEPYLVRDIDPGTGVALGSVPALISSGAAPAFMIAGDEEHGRELWLSDGSAGGTRLLRDICPGRCSSDPSFQGLLGDRLLFSARSAIGAPTNLWISDGTWEGTRALGAPLVDNNAAVGSLEASGLFFFASYHGSEFGLWVTDGTPAGTRPVGLDGPDGWPRVPGPGAVAGGRLVFGASSPIGRATWVTDGTDSGTHRLAQIPPDRHPSRVLHVQRLGSRAAAFVRTRTGSACEAELWFTDGTPEGSSRLLTFDEPFCQQPTRFWQVAEADGALWFDAQQGAGPPQLWRTDGTPAGTRPVTSFTGTGFAGQPFAMDDDATLFVADDGVHGREPWVADSSGARLLADICSGGCSSSPGTFLSPGTIYFTANDGLHGTELWRREGPAAVLVEDVCPGGCSSFPTTVGAAGGRLFFAAGEIGGNPGRELWATPLGANGAARLTDYASANPFSLSSARYRAVATGDLILFAADDGDHGFELWRSDGSPAGTALVADLETRSEPGAGSDPTLLTPWGDLLLFFAREPEIGYQPWISDGTEGGTRRLGVITAPENLFEARYSEPLILGADALFVAKDGFEAPLVLWRARTTGAPVPLLTLGDGSAQSVASRLLGGRAVFVVPGGPSDASGLWVSDGTTAGTQRLRELRITYASAGGEDVGELGGRLFYAATEDLDGFGGFGLWATDGTPTGTTRVAEINSSASATPPGAFTRLGNRLLFAADGEIGGRELWSTDGTGAGTVLVADLVAGHRDSDPRSLTTVGARVFFFAHDDGGSLELWTSDGSAAGTLRVAGVPSLDTFPAGVPKYAGAGGRFWFVVGGADRPDLWVSDGTPPGTGSLRPLLPENANVRGVWSAGDHVRMAMTTSTPDGTVEELWQTDGTLAGTRRLLSLPSASSASSAAAISGLTQVGSLLYLSGFHPQAGQELMALPLGPPAPCSADAETLCLGDGRFAVRARWRDPRSGDMGTAGALPLPGSDRTGLFWFFAPDNVELVVKTLDGGGVNGHFWNFYGALSDVEYTIEVTDQQTGRRVEYFNPGGEICGRGDTTAFPARPPVPLPVPAPAASPVRSAAAPGVGGTACGGTPADLCLLDGRFRIEVAWADQRSGDSGAGTAIPYADRSGFFWFFNQQNVELVVKIIDGRNVNGRFWVFYGALTDVEYTITVTDTETGDHASYQNPPGEICGRGDTAAF